MANEIQPVALADGYLCKAEPFQMLVREERTVVVPRAVTTSLLSLLTACLPFLARAQTADLPACLHKVVRFDGSWPLQFERVSGLSETRLYIHESFPQNCSSAKTSCAGGPSYLLGGDEVAEGKICGKWAYIQYVGLRYITKGWVDSSRLKFLRKVGAGTAQPLFTLIKGHGNPVCEAYLQRLNVTDYTQNFPTVPAPYCGIPENAQIPGFTMLHRVPLTSAQLVELSGDVYKWWERPNPRLTADWNATPEQVRLGGLSAWRYEPSLDINNDGQKQDVTVWRGYGLSGAAGRCGEPINQNYAWGVRWQQLPLIMKRGLQIDTARTAEIFGRVFMNGSREESPAQHPFTPVGFFVTPFVYKETTYFSAFFDDDGDYEGKRRGVWKLWNVLGVLARNRGRTQELCEYQLRGNDYPKANTGLEQ